MACLVEPAFKLWAYPEAREALWPASRHSKWIPWSKPSGKDALPIDGEIEKLITKTAPAPRMKSRSDFLPLGSGTPNAFLQRVGELDVFCPYRETRAHWIPFALQVARIASSRHQNRNKLHDQLVRDIKTAIEALDRYCRHDPDALARIDRPLLARITSRAQNPDAPATESDANIEWTAVAGCENLRVGPIEDATDADLERLHDPIASNLGREALKSAKSARKAIAFSFEFSKGGKSSFDVGHGNLSEWRISFAATLGFAWRRMTGRNPAAYDGSPFLGFVAAAYISLGKSKPLDSWERPCRAAVLRYRADFSLVDEDPTLMSVAPEVWRDIPLQPPVGPTLTDLPVQGLNSALEVLRRLK